MRGKPEHQLVKIGNSPNFYVQWFEDGHSRRCSTRTSSSEEAQAFLAAFVLEFDQAPAADLSVSDVLNWYWTSYAEKELARPSNADLAIRNLKPFFGSTRTSDCSVAKQQAYVQRKRDQGYGAESIRRDLSVLSAAMKRAEKHGRIDRAPPMMTVAPAPPRDRWLSRQEVARLWWALRGPRSRHVLLFAKIALYTGARTGAILDLTWDRVDFEAGLLHFPMPGKRQTKKRRTVSPMGAILRSGLLAAYKRRRSEHVIEWAGQRIDRVAKAFITASKTAAIKNVSPHVLRHTFATWAVRKGAPIYMVGKALGQTVASTTERYAKHAPDDIAKVMEIVRRK